LSSLRTVRNRIPSTLTRRLVGSAIAVAAFASGATATALAGPAGPAGPAVASRAADVPAGPVGAAGQPVASVASFTSPVAASGDIVLLATARTPREIARAMLPTFHWSVSKQFRYLSWLWQRESGWNKYASNPYSGAYGIPQALPGSKMASAGPNWRSNASTQIRWGLRYIRARYGSPHRAWNHSQATGWY
jgi:hypothetical protein